MSRRGFNINSLDNYFNYFNVNAQGDKVYLEPPFKNHHTHRYLLQCFYNLQEKYDRGQKDFSKKQYEKLEDFIKQRNANIVFEKYIKTKRESLCKKYGQDFYIDPDKLCNVGE